MFHVKHNRNISVPGSGASHLGIVHAKDLLEQLAGNGGIDLRAASVRVRLGDGGRGKRVGAIEPGVTFGEFALFENSRRIADVVAAGPAACYVLPVERLTSLAKGNPTLHARLLRNIMRGMADRLRRATDEIRALED